MESSGNSFKITQLESKNTSIRIKPYAVSQYQVSQLEHKYTISQSCYKVQLLEK